MLRCLERKVLEKIYGAYYENGSWEAEVQHGILHPVPRARRMKIIKGTWVFHVMNMHEGDPIRKT